MNPSWSFSMHDAEQDGYHKEGKGRGEQLPADHRTAQRNVGFRTVSEANGHWNEPKDRSQRRHENRTQPRARAVNDRRFQCLLMPKMMKNKFNQEHAVG